jgi:hypothetical protein
LSFLNFVAIQPNSKFFYIPTKFSQALETFRFCSLV